MTGTKTWICGLALGVTLAACSEPVTNPKCNLNTDCIAGSQCNPSGECVKADPLVIKAATLPDAVVGDGSYSLTLQAEGGVSPYSWSYTDASEVDKQGKLDWLEIDEATGKLRAKAGQAPSESAEGLRIKVTVLDRSNGGQGNSAERLFDLKIVDCNKDELCYIAEGGACQEGIRHCVDDILQADCLDAAPSGSLEHCGPDCDACPAGADRCSAGLCKCGGIDACAGAESCCGNDGCFDLQSSAGHCGDCDTDCAATVTGVANYFCNAGACDYDDCDANHLDCDGNRNNGCETLVDKYNCAACGNDCTDASDYPQTANQDCENSVCAFDCQAGYADCMGDGAGCGTLLGTNTDCTDCGDACSGDVTPVCLDTADRCGCNDQQDCPADRLCCGTRTCVIHSEANCTGCGEACSVKVGGLSCNGDVSSGWACECNGLHSECWGAYQFSMATCYSHQCRCSATENCAGTIDDMCCEGGVDYTCVNLLTDPENCGICGRACAASESCLGGVCGCTGGTCGNMAGEAWQCVSNSCVCPTFLNEPCPAGQYCCPSKGCCTKSCASADIDADCSIGCSNDHPGASWCYWGCCTDCADQSECDDYAPPNFPF
jgi:hypothetical protein